MDILRVDRSVAQISLTDSAGRVRYTIDSEVDSSGWWPCSKIRSISQSRCPLNDSPDYWLDEIADIIWNPQQPYVLFGRTPVTFDAFLRIDKRFDNSRVFIGPDKSPLRWKLRRGNLELKHDGNAAIIARWCPSRSGIKLLSIKAQHDALEVQKTYSKDPKFLNAIVITWAVLDGILQNKESSSQ